MGPTSIFVGADLELCFFPAGSSSYQKRALSVCSCLVGSDFKAYPVLATYDIRDVPDVVADIRADIDYDIRIYGYRS